MSEREQIDLDCQHHDRFRSYPDDGGTAFCTQCEIERLRKQLDAPQSCVEGHISLLRQELAEARALLREACDSMPDTADGWAENWIKRAEKAGGGE